MLPLFGVDSIKITVEEGKTLRGKVTFFIPFIEVGWNKLEESSAFTRIIEVEIKNGIGLKAIERMKCVELTHTRLLVNNYQECYKFYSEVLQFPCTWGDESSNYAQFTVGTTQLAIFEKQQMLEDMGESLPSLEENTFQSMLIFRVADVDRTYEKLQSKVGFINEPHDRKDWGIRVAHFKDPEGNVIEINHNL